MQPRPTTEISALEARRQFGELMNRAYYGGESFIVKRDNLPMIKIEPVYDEQQKEQARKEFFAFVEEIRAELAKHDPQEVDEAFEEAIAYARSNPQ